MRPVVLSIAGSDSSAGAGIQADLKAIEASGGYAATAITAITAQNTCGVRRADPVDPELVRAQIDAVFDDLDVRAIKSGMLPTVDVVDAVGAALAVRAPVPWVLDPVMRAKGGDVLIDEPAARRIVATLFPRATLITPNVGEAAALSGERIDDLEGAARAGRRLLDLGARAVLVKGGHLLRERGVDTLVTPQGLRLIREAWIDTRNTHGTGCTYAAAIATGLALGFPLEAAIVRARGYLTQALRHALPLGSGQGPPDALFALHAADAPSAT